MTKSFRLSSKIEKTHSFMNKGKIVIMCYVPKSHSCLANGFFQAEGCLNTVSQCTTLFQLSARECRSVGKHFPIRLHRDNAWFDSKN